MKFFKLCALISVAIIFSGCATAPIGKDVSQALRSSKVAVVYAQLNKKIHYEELVYKVLYNETRTQDVSFDGLWDIDSELSNFMAPKVSELGLKVVSIYDFAPKETVLDLHRTLSENLLKALTEKSGLIPLVLSENLRSKLLENGIDYLIVIDSNNIRVYTQIGVKQGSLRTSMYVQDVRSNEQKYYCYFPVGGNLKVNKSVREIEDNNLAGLKKAMKEWLEASISKDMPKRLGFIE